MTSGEIDQHNASIDDAQTEIRSLKIELTLILTCLSILVLGLIVAYLYASSKNFQINDLDIMNRKKNNYESKKSDDYSTAISEPASFFERIS